MVLLGVLGGHWGRPVEALAGPQGSVAAPPRNAATQPRAAPAPNVAAGSTAQLSSPLISQADALTNEKKYEEALSLYLKAYEITPLPSLLLAIGICHAALDQLALAKQKCDLFESTVAAPSPTEASNLAECRKLIFVQENSNAGAQAYQRGEFKRARESFEAAYAITNDPGFLPSIAKCYQSEERWADMLDRCIAFERALPSPTDADREYIATCKRIAGPGIKKKECLDDFTAKDYALAVNSCASAFDLTKDLSLLLRKGVAEAQLGAMDRARADCGRFDSDSAPGQRSDSDRALLTRCNTLIAQWVAATTKPSIPEKEPVYRKKWFLPVVIGAGILALTAVGIGIGAGVAANQTPPYMDIVWR